MTGYSSRTLTVKEFKKIVADLPDVDKTGNETLVWVTGDGPNGVTSDIFVNTQCNKHEGHLLLVGSKEGQTHYGDANGNFGVRDRVVDDENYDDLKSRYEILQIIPALPGYEVQLDFTTKGEKKSERLPIFAWATIRCCNGHKVIDPVYIWDGLVNLSMDFYAIDNIDDDRNFTVLYNGNPQG